MARARRRAADTATSTSADKPREQAGAPRAPQEREDEKKKPRASQKGDKKRVRVSEGVYRDRYGLAATVKVNGIQRERRFQRDTGLRTIQAWRAETRGSLVTLPKGAKHNAGVRRTTLPAPGRERAGQHRSTTPERRAMGREVRSHPNAHARTAHRRTQRAAAHVAERALGRNMQPPPGRPDEPSAGPLWKEGRERLERPGNVSETARETQMANDE